MRATSFCVLVSVFGAMVSQAEKAVHIRVTGLKLHGQTQDSNGEDEMNIGMYGMGCGATGECYVCENYQNAFDEQYMCAAFYQVHVGKSDCCVLVETVDILRQVDNVKAFWPYYDMVAQQKVQANETRQFTDTCPLKLARGQPAYLMLQEEDMFINDASTTVKLEASRVESFYKMFEEMEADTEEGGKVGAVQLAFSYGFKELNVQMLLEQQMPGVSFLIDIMKDQLCVGAMDVVAFAGGKVASSVGKAAAKAAYTKLKGGAKAASRAQAFARNADDVAEVGGTVASKLTSKSLKAVGDFLDMTEFCVVDFIGEGQDAKYEIFYELTYEDVNTNCTVSTDAHSAFGFLPLSLLLLLFLK